jgi:TolA-binding protein
MAALIRLLALSLLLSVVLPAPANEKIGKDDLDAQKELLQLKIDSGRELIQKDLETLKTRIDALDKRIDDQNNRVGDIGQSVDRFAVIVGFFGLLVTVLIALGGLVGYFSVAKKAAEEAKLASQEWFDDNQQKLATRIQELEKAAEQAHQRIDNSVNDVEQHSNAAIDQMQTGMNASSGQAQPISAIEQQALHQSAEQIKGRPEASYSFEDWNKRAFDAYHSRQYENAALYWKNASNIPNAGAANTAQALLNRAVALNRLKRHDEACTTYQQLIATYSPDNTPAVRELVANAMLNLGVTLGEMERLAEAIATYEQLIATYSPDNTPAVRELVAKAMLAMGGTVGQMQKPAEAIATYERLIATYSPDNTPAVREQAAKAMLNLGVTLGDMEKLAEAIATYEQLIATYSPDNTPAVREQVAKAMLNLGITLGEMQKPAEKIATYDKLIATYLPDNTPAIREQVSSALNSKGFARLMEAKKAREDSDRASALLRDAQTDLLASLDMRADCGLTRGNLAYVQWLLGDRQAAEESFRAALASAQNGGEALYHGTLGDIGLHTIPEDETFRGMVERQWTEYQAGKSSGGVIARSAHPAPDY